MSGYVEGILISIHAPRGGSDRRRCARLPPDPYFNPRSPWGERHLMGKASTRAQKFQSTLPVGGATAPPLAPRRSAHDFNPRSPWGERQLSAIIPCVLEHFNPRSPWGERQRFFLFLSTPKPISIHAPRGGSDWPNPAVPRSPRHFNPRSPWGERRRLVLPRLCGRAISIHAPRGGSDRLRRDDQQHPAYFNPRSPWGERRYGTGKPLQPQIFQSTLPVGGATFSLSVAASLRVISIHAPRGGSDGTGQGSPCSPRYFNPRSPWGERHAGRH